MTRIIRLLSSIVLLCIVAKNAHWSVTLCLVLLFITSEMTTSVINRTTEQLLVITSILVKGIKEK